MTGQFSYLQFLRRIPNEFLAKYFAAKNIDLGVNFKELKKDRENIIFQAIIKLSEEQQTVIETEFQDVNAMACDGGITVLTDEANFHEDPDFVESISIINGFHAKAMWAFLEKNDYWRAAAMFLHADNICASYWKKRNDFSNSIPYVGKSHIEEFEKAISNFFHQKEGRGRNCKVEVYRRYNKEYFFAYPEDFGQSEVEWVKDKLNTRPYHPAFEIIFVYCQDENSLDIYAPKNNKAVPKLQQIFAQTILKLNTFSDSTIDQHVYNLEPMADPNFEFEIESNSGISSVVVNKFRLTLKYGVKQRITVEADTSKNPKATYELLKTINPPAHYITQVSMKVTFEPKQGRRAQTRTFGISYPNYCSLNHDGRDRIIRDMLIKSGIEPK
jgi:hypothetical protein